MPAVTLLLLAASFGLAPAPVSARRRLSWLAATRWGGRARDQHVDPKLWAALAWRALAGSRWSAAWVGLFLGLAAGLAAGLLPALLAAVAGSGLARGTRLVGAERDGERRRDELAATVAALHDEYAAGATVAAAFAAAAPSAGRFEAAVRGAAVLAGQGDDVADALRAEDGLARLAVACDLVGRSGASLGRLLAGLRTELAADRQTHRTVRTALAGPRSSALLLAGLPVIGVVMGAAMGADPVRVLLHTTAGQLALAAGVMLDVAGLSWTLALSRRALP